MFPFLKKFCLIDFLWETKVQIFCREVVLFGNILTFDLLKILIFNYEYSGQKSTYIFRKLFK